MLQSTKETRAASIGCTESNVLELNDAVPILTDEIVNLWCDILTEMFIIFTILQLLAWIRLVLQQFFSLHGYLSFSCRQPAHGLHPIFVAGFTSIDWYSKGFSYIAHGLKQNIQCCCTCNCFYCAGKKSFGWSLSFSCHKTIGKLTDRKI